ncbi:MAG: STAS domain-containing protein [Treponema sp.]|nr:STAS domain-containing protein [Treponema sp.]
MARKKSASSVIVLKENVGIEQAAQIKEQLLTAIKKNQVTQLDLSQVTDIDTSILQLIIAASKEAASQEKEFYVLDSLPEDVKSFVNLLSLKLPVQNQGGN